MKNSELRKKLKEIKQLAKKESIDISKDLENLEAKIKGESNNLTVWNRVELARHADRPTTLEYIDQIFDDFFELHGDRLYGDDPALIGGIATLEGLPVTVIGHQKGRNMKENMKRNYGMAHPEGYRKALRLAQQAEKFGRPIISFIDTPGAFPGIAAEERGIGESIARNLKIFSTLKVPVICYVIGEGGSGGALGIGVGNSVFMLKNSIYSVITPEGFASILLRDASKSKEAAEIMKITSDDLLSFGIVDGIIDEVSGGAQKDLEFTSKLMKKSIKETLEILLQKTPDQLVKERSAKFQKMGLFYEKYDRKQGFFSKVLS